MAVTVKRALISVSDKTGIVDFAKDLTALGVEIISTGGTYKLLKENDVPVIEVSDVTGFPEMLDGRVKTLHPMIHGGLLARRDLPEHMSAIAEKGIGPIDMVVVNLYPFQQTVAKAGVTPEMARTNIDIGGPCMVRASAKNYLRVASVTDPLDYPNIAQELESHGGTLGLDTRFKLMKKAFTHTAEYDTAISKFFTTRTWEEVEKTYNLH